MMKTSSASQLLALPFLALIGIAPILAATSDSVATAETYRRQGELPSALLTLKSLLQSHPDDAAGRVALARVYLDFRQGAMAEQELNRALSLGVERAEVAADLARSMLLQGEYARALDAAAMRHDPLDGPRRAELLAIQAQAYAGMNKNDAAGRALSSALKADSTSEFALLEQARLEWSNGARESARQTLERLRVDNPESPRVASAVAEFAMEEGNFNAAETNLPDELLSNAPNRWVLLYQRASARIGGGDLAGALADIEAGEKLYPQFLGFQLLRGQLLYEKGQYAGALRLLSNFLRVNPKDATANLYAGAAELKQGHLERAREYLTRHFDVAPDSHRGALMLASVQVGQADLRGAAGTLRPLIDQKPPVPEALKALAQVRELEGATDEAILLYRRYLDIEPGDGDARVRLSRVLASSGDLSGAQEQADAAVSSGPDLISARLQRIAIAIQQQRSGRALELASRLVAEYPKSGAAHAAYAAAYAAEGDVESARRELEQGWAVDPSFTDSAFKLARIATAEGKLEAARRYYEAILAREPSNSLVILLLAQLDIAEGQAGEGRKRLEDALLADPAQTDIRLNLANGYLNAHRLEDARRLMQEVPSSVADDPRVLRAQGQLALSAGEPFAAVSLFEQLAQRAPESAEAHYLLATALAGANNTGDAASSLVKAYKLDPMNEQTAPSFKAVLAAMPSFVAKQRLVADLEAANPGQPRGAYFEALMLQETAKPDQALAILEDLHEKHPDDRLYYDALVTQEARSGDKASAIETASAWLARHPEDVQASRQLAQLHAEQGDRQRALKAYQAVISENPNDAVALNNLAELLRESRPAEALEYAKRAHAAAPANPAIRDTLGMALLATGDLAGALENLEAAYKDAAGNPQVDLHYVQALIAAGKRDQARSLLQELASKSFDGADEAKTLLDQLK
jgi:putative PEP-CTERM system TPR-repeat lipoprotein